MWGAGRERRRGQVWQHSVLSRLAIMQAVALFMAAADLLCLPNPLHRLPAAAAPRGAPSSLACAAPSPTGETIGRPHSASSQGARCSQARSICGWRPSGALRGPQFPACFHTPAVSSDATRAGKCEQTIPERLRSALPPAAAAVAHRTPPAFGSAAGGNHGSATLPPPSHKCVASLGSLISVTGGVRCVGEASN